MELRKMNRILPAAILLITVGSPSLHADLKKSHTDDWDRYNNIYPNNPVQLRSLIDQLVGIDKLKVPARNADIPVPKPYQTGIPTQSQKRYETTEEKRFLGKMLFFDPIRTARINKNEKQPENLPEGTAFGGTLQGADLASVPALVDATKQTGSCASCHFGEAATKAGAQINLHVGAEGIGYTDKDGNFIVRRRTQSILVQKRDQPIFPGDTLVDALPTLTDIDIINGKREVTIPSPFYHRPESGAEKLLATGRLDELDSVGRKSMSVIGFAFNNRLLFGGFGGEVQSVPFSLNPFNDPAGENMTLLLLDAHRMLEFQSSELIKIPAFVKLFQDAFPEEAADAKGDLTKLITDQTVLRATATFLRTVVTRNTPFDHFLSGDNRALTASQRRGARLFFTPAKEGGAGCVSCHSGPMLNKQANDPDVAGIGKFIEENFINVGRGDHPVQALNALAKGELDPKKLGKDGFPYHAQDTGRFEITQNPEHIFKFRSLGLRQLKDARNFFHDGTLTKIRDVVEYFNRGIPDDPTAGAAKTLDVRFTNPRGSGYPRGLGLTAKQVDDLTDFLENGLYDQAFVKYDPKSTTDRFQPHEGDLSYSKYRPDLVAVSAASKIALKDGFMPSGLPIQNDDPLSRRDQGLEFLDVTDKVNIEPISSYDFHWGKSEYDDDENDDRHYGATNTDRFRITNTGESIIDTHLLVIVKGLPKGVRLRNANGKTRDGDPYRRIFLRNGVLKPDQSLRLTLRFNNRNWKKQVPYSMVMLSGQGKP
jgi:Di-haem cytochrome c peroxidase